MTNHTEAEERPILPWTDPRSTPEPSDAERAGWSEATRHYVESLESLAERYDTLCEHYEATRNTPDEATALADEPVAFLYESETGDKDLVLDCNGEYARRLLELGRTETPLYAAPPVDRNTVLEAVHAVAKIEMDREGYPLSRSQGEIYADAGETVDAVLAALRTEAPALVEEDDIWGCEYCRNDGQLTPEGICPRCDAKYDGPAQGGE